MVGEKGKENQWRKNQKRSKMEYLVGGVLIALIIILWIAIFKPFKHKEKEQCIHLWGNVEDGWQYCTKCGLARVAGCVHDWAEIKNQNIMRSTDSGIIGNEIHYKCKKCSQIKYVRTSLTEEPVVKLI